MTYTKGMDAAAIQNSGSTLRGLADEVDFVRGAGRNAVARIAQVWQGGDADEFQRDWVHIAAALTGLSGSLGRFAGVLDANVQAQLGASGNAELSGWGGRSAPLGPSAGVGFATGGLVGGLPGSTFAPWLRQEPSFADTIRGTDPLPIDRDLLEMSSQTYENHPADVNGFTALTPAEVDALGLFDSSMIDNDEWNGLGATIYRNDEGQYVVAFRGSDGGQWTDWAQDLGQGLGLPMPQYMDAIQIATAMHDEFGDDVVFTGHSLGGGLATVAAAATGSPAVTFNAAGVEDGHLLTAAAESSTVSSGPGRAPRSATTWPMVRCAPIRSRARS